MARDTTEAAARAQLEIYRRLGGSGRMKLAFEMSVLAKELALTRLRREHPEWSLRELHAELLGESERQLEDVAGILRIRASDLDTSYLDRWLQLEQQWEVAHQKV